MKSRLLVAAVGVPLLLIVLLLCPSFCTAILVVLLSVIGANELLNTTGILTHKRMLVYAEVMACLTTVWSYLSCNPDCAAIWSYGISSLFAGAILLTVFVVLLYIEALAAYPAVHFAGITGAIFAGVLIPLSLSGIARLLVMDNGRFYVLIPILIPFIADAGAYFAGRALGKHKMAPVLSPHKTIEGAVGGLAAGIISMILYCVIVHFAFGKACNYGYAAIYGVIGSVISIIGDLSFSMVKRETGIKDYGTIFRAHGGVLDRFDSVIFSAPVIEILILLLPAIH